MNPDLWWLIGGITALLVGIVCLIWACQTGADQRPELRRMILDILAAGGKSLFEIQREVERRTGDGSFREWMIASVVEDLVEEGEIRCRRVRRQYVYSTPYMGSEIT